MTSLASNDINGSCRQKFQGLVFELHYSWLTSDFWHCGDSQIVVVVYGGSRMGSCSMHWYHGIGGHYGLQKEQGWTKFPIDDFYSKKLSWEFAWRISKNLNIWLVASQAFSSWRFWPDFPILEPYRDCINHNFALERDTDLNLVSILMFLGMRNHLGWVSDTSDWL